MRIQPGGPAITSDSGNSLPPGTPRASPRFERVRSGVSEGIVARMDWKTLLSTFAAVFLAELGDKTQLATFALSASARSKLPVLLGAALALVCSSVLAVAAGAAIGKAVPPIWLRRGAGALMLVLGALLLIQRGD